MAFLVQRTAHVRDALVPGSRPNSLDELIDRAIKPGNYQGERHRERFSCSLPPESPARHREFSMHCPEPSPRAPQSPATVLTRLMGEEPMQLGRVRLTTIERHRRLTLPVLHDQKIRLVRAPRSAGEHDFFLRYALTSASTGGPYRGFRGLPRLWRGLLQIAHNLSASAPSIRLRHRPAARGRPLSRYLYNLSKPEHLAMERYISESLAAGFIRPSSAPVDAGFFFVKKKDGTSRPCLDCQS